MNDLITGYSALHLKNFSAEELDALASHMIETGQTGLTYRCYGGGNVTAFVMDAKLANFIKQVEGEVVLTWTKGNSEAVGEGAMPSFVSATEFCRIWGIPIKAVQWQNELYLFDPPTWRDGWREWFDYNFRKAKYYRELAIDHIWELAGISQQLYNIGDIVVNLPLKVNQNAGYKAYAKEWLEMLSDFDISLHVYGVPASILRDNLQWYKENTNRKIHIGEFNGKKNERNAWPEKNSMAHALQHIDQLNVIHDVLGDQLGDVLLFTLAGNDTTAGWEEPPYLHKYQVKQSISGNHYVVNTIENVWP